MRPFGIFTGFRALCQIAGAWRGDLAFAAVLGSVTNITSAVLFGRRLNDANVHPSTAWSVLPISFPSAMTLHLSVTKALH